MNAEQFIEKNLRDKLPGIDSAAIEAALQHFRRNKAEKKGKMFEECLKIAKQHMVKVKK